MAGIHLVFLLLALLVFSTSAKVFLSIDCGANDTYTDGNTIKWIPDVDYIKSGESRLVSSANLVDQVVDSLRVFKTGTKNCYSIKVDKGERVLVRASFYYGNYDNKLVPPKFDLELNGKYWATVETYLLKGIYMYYEAMYVVEEGNISVCLVQTLIGHYPFISALEVRSLDANMYSGMDSNRTLYMMQRVFGSKTEYVRYPDDIYDRVWHPTIRPSTISNALLSISVKVEDNPPQTVMRNAITSTGTNLPISYSLTNLPAYAVPVYINMYFAELVKLDSSDKRSFHVYIDNKRLSSTPITPTYGSVMELTFTSITASNTTVFSLEATSDSTMPPIINALEAFVYNDYDKNNDNSKNNGKNVGSRSDTHLSMFIICIYMVYQLF